MTKVIDVAELGERVSATEAKLNAAGQEGRRHVVRLLGLLDVVEKDLTHKQQQISRLEEENSRAVEQVRQLTKLLGDMLTMVETAEDGPRVAIADLDQLSHRLGTITSKMNHDAGEGIETARSSDSLTELVDHDTALRAHG